MTHSVSPFLKEVEEQIPLDRRVRTQRSVSPPTYLLSSGARLLSQNREPGGVRYLRTPGRSVIVGRAGDR
jgi:hypothetical protein